MILTLADVMVPSLWESCKDSTPKVLLLDMLHVLSAEELSEALSMRLERMPDLAALTGRMLTAEPGLAVTDGCTFKFKCNCDGPPKGPPTAEPLMADPVCGRAIFEFEFGFDCSKLLTPREAGRTACKANT